MKRIRVGFGAALSLIGFGAANAYADVEVHWWHAMGGRLGE